MDILYIFLLKTKERISELNSELKLAYEKLKNIRANRDFVCSCGNLHKIKNCDAIQVLDYIPPSGHCDGDYHVDGIIIIICPVTKYSNRILFHEPYENKHKIERAFKNMYGGLFKSMTEVCSTKLDMPNKKNNDYFTFKSSLIKFEIDL